MFWLSVLQSISFLHFAKGCKLPVEWTGLVCRMQYCRRQAANFLQRQPWFTTPLVERLVSSMYILNRKLSLPSAVFILQKADQTIPLSTRSKWCVGPLKATNEDYSKYELIPLDAESHLSPETD